MIRDEIFEEAFLAKYGGALRNASVPAGAVVQPHSISPRTAKDNLEASDH